MTYNILIIFIYLQFICMTSINSFQMVRHPLLIWKCNHCWTANCSSSCPILMTSYRGFQPAGESWVSTLLHRDIKSNEEVTKYVSIDKKDKSLNDWMKNSRRQVVTSYSICSQLAVYDMQQVNRFSQNLPTCWYFI